MTSIPITDILTIILCWSMTGIKPKGTNIFKEKREGSQNSRTEVMTLIVAQDFIPYPSETQSIGDLRAYYLALFPKLLDQSQFNRRARGLRLLVEQLRRHWIVKKGWHLDNRFLLDTKPIPVIGYKRYKNCH